MSNSETGPVFRQKPEMFINPEEGALLLNLAVGEKMTSIVTNPSITSRDLRGICRCLFFRFRKRSIGEGILYAKKVGQLSFFEPDLISSINHTMGSRDEAAQKQQRTVILDKVVRMGNLSYKELEVLVQAAQGFSNREIADRTYKGVSTIRTHMRHLLKKLELSNRYQASALLILAAPACKEININTLAVLRLGRLGPIEIDITARQDQILILILDGYPNRAIAVMLGIEENTVKAHIRNLAEFLEVPEQVKKRPAIIARAFSNGLVDMDAIRQRYAPQLRQLDRLTDRESEVFSMIGDGMSNREICKQLEIAQGTCKIHTNAIFNKLGVSKKANRRAVATVLAQVQKVEQQSQRSTN